MTTEQRKRDALEWLNLSTQDILDERWLSGKDAREMIDEALQNWKKAKNEN